ncbi:hypothetical protein FH975_11490 [Nesterenkonia sp. Hz 6-5]|nr:hypothetical protein [Nesterenkonia haasae]
MAAAAPFHAAATRPGLAGRGGCRSRDTHRSHLLGTGASGYFDRSLRAYGQVGRECSRCAVAGRSGGVIQRSSSWPFFLRRHQLGSSRLRAESLLSSFWSSGVAGLTDGVQRA